MEYPFHILILHIRIHPAEKQTLDKNTMSGLRKVSMV